MTPYYSIAKQLAINYFNVSVRPDKSDKEAKDEMEIILEKVFGKDEIGNLNVTFEEAAYSRNILIIGAGASKGQIDSVADGNGVIDAVERNLGFEEIMGKEVKGIKVFEKRYRSLASHYNKKVYGPDITIDKIKKQLGFEGRLSMLLNFYDKQEVLNEIKTILDFQHLPVNFYEIVAHLFKHRFIDIIINFNFDELLDNAIEDEMGSGTYFKVVHDSDCLSISEIADSNMLRTPVYIKPHGTISSKTSLLFTKEHYIDMSEDMKFLLKSIFMGNIGAKNRIVENFNILIAGFAMESIELNDILFTQIRRKATEISPKIRHINYYFFTDKNDIIKEKFKSEYIIWQSNLVDDGIDLSLDEFHTKFNCDSDHTLANHFQEIYKTISSLIDKPFKPIALFLHEVLTLLFPKEKIQHIGNALLKNEKAEYIHYLKCRFIFHALYELLKCKGRLTINVMIYERSGKYYREYLNSLDEDTRLAQPDLISFLKIHVKLKNLEIVENTETVFEYHNYYTQLNTLRDSERQAVAEKFMDEIIARMIAYSLVGIISNEAVNILKHRLKMLFSDILDSGLLEITPVYNVTRHVRFRPLTKPQIMPTSLTLTFVFFKFSTFPNYFSKWDTLYFSGDSAMPIYNLHRYATEKKSYLEKIKEEKKKVHLLLSETNRSVIVDNISERGLNVNTEKRIATVDAVKKILSSDNLIIKSLSNLENVHHMALFLKGKKPVFGLYFFKPQAQNRISPIHIDSGSRQIRDIENLKKMKELFEREFKRGENI